MTGAKAQRVTGALSIVISILSSGCGDVESFVEATPKQENTHRHIATVRYLESSDPNAEEVDRFRRGEVPAIKIKGCGGHTAWFIVVELTAGKTVRTESVDIPKGKTIYWPLPGLSPGSYRASLKVAGVTHRERCTFMLED